MTFTQNSQKAQIMFWYSYTTDTDNFIAHKFADLTQSACAIRYWRIYFNCRYYDDGILISFFFPAELSSPQRLVPFTTPLVVTHSWTCALALCFARYNYLCLLFPPSSQATSTFCGQDTCQYTSRLEHNSLAKGDKFHSQYSCILQLLPTLSAIYSAFIQFYCILSRFASYHIKQVTSSRVLVWRIF